MNTKGLSLNTIPPISIPLRFFLTAPFFGIFAALMVLYYGLDVWASRWLAGSLALTHLLTIGFMLMVMIGALYQFVPVMIGQLIPGGEKRVAIVHIFLTLGTLSLIPAFLFGQSFLFWLALIFLGISLFMFALSLLPLLVAQLNDHLIVYLMRVLFFVLIVTIGLGLFMLMAYAYPDLELAYRQYTDIHASWGLLGWVVILIMAVSSQVIPMFFVTPEFSIRYLKILSFLIVLTLTMMSLLAQINDAIQAALNVILSVELSFFSIYTLRLMNQRKRKLPDVTINFWRVSLFSLMLSIVYWWVLFLGSNTETFPLKWSSQSEFTLGVLLIYGLAISAIIGMLQKIVPFLLYLHLQNVSFKHPESMSADPKLVLNMKQIISNQHSKIQLSLHLSSFLLLLISIYWEQLIWVAGLMMMLNFMWLSIVLFKSFNLFSKNYKAIMMYPELKMDFEFKK